MQCIKCGRDVEPDQVFCNSCKETMAKYPVRPGVVVQLPRRTETVVKKQPSRRRATLSAEEQLILLRRAVRRLAVLAVLLLAAVIGLSWLTVSLYRESENKVLPGQNYYSATTPAETTEPAAETTEDPEYGMAG